MLRRIFLAFFFLLLLAALELNKNRLWRFAVFLLLPVLYVLWRETAL